jgi:hypothetical protein
MTTPAEAEVTPTYKPFTKAERIQQLNNIDKVLPAILLFPDLY